MLRIQFSEDDLARVRIASQPDPLWELVLAIRLFRRRPGDGLFTTWRTEAMAQLQHAGLREQLTLLRALLPPAGYFPDFLNPTAAADGLDDGLEAIRSTQSARLHRDITQLAASRQLPASAGSIADGSKRHLAELVDTMRTCYELIVRPYEQDIKAAFERDRSAKLEAFASGGVHGLFENLRPFACWTGNELCVPNHRSQNLQLRNRGLLLIPTSFCISTPVTLFDSDLPPVLIYPANPRFNNRWPEESTSVESLGSLIGATRAAILHTVSQQHGVNSSHLAKQLALSMASVSEHARALREAGLIISQRDRNRLLHRVTPLGHALLVNALHPIRGGMRNGVAIDAESDR